MKSQPRPAAGENGGAPAPELEELRRLRAVIAKLRAPDGCSWDREQDFASMKPRFLEEVYEYIDALENDDRQGMQEELGDLFFHLLFAVLLGEEEGSWSLAAILAGIREKLVRRHPHVFAAAGRLDSGEVRDQWEEIKRRVEGKNYQSVLDGIPRSLPPLQKAYQFGKQCRKIGFDWPTAAAVVPKVHEELREVEEALAGGRRRELQEELGDLMFVIVSLVRLLEFDPDSLLQAANRKFERRLRAMEAAAARQQRSLAAMSLDEQEELWQQVKKQI
ncbi:MAG: nucleoside triphosphate pyrophosphohydrolase [Deltaproteobacteria bacterium]|nr:nucleoside triphosphate pyrophosphohydrolase [Deltaproteobacteria bacterium]